MCSALTVVCSSRHRSFKVNLRSTLPQVSSCHWQCPCHASDSDSTLCFQFEVALLSSCFALLSSHFQVKPTHSLHTTTDKLSRLCLAPWEVATTRYAVDTIDVQAPCWVQHDSAEDTKGLETRFVTSKTKCVPVAGVSLGNAMKAKESKAKPT